MPRYPLLPNCVYRETFESLASVAQNGGVNSLCTVAKGASPTTTSANIQAPNQSNLLSGATKATFVLRFKTASTTLGALSRRLFDKANAALTNNQWLILQNTGTRTLSFYVPNSPTDYANYVVSSVSLGLATEYVVHFVYDGSLAAASRVKIYINGTLDGSPTITGTIAASMQRVTQTPATFGLTANAAPDSDFIMRSIEVFNTAFTQEDVTDSYQNDTITELDASKSLVNLPLKSWYWKENGTELLVGGVTAANYTAGNSAVLTNPTSDVLRVAKNGVNYPGAYQSVVTSGKRYKITGEARTDGANNAYFSFGSTFSVNVATSTDTSFKAFSFEAVADGTGAWLQGGTGAGYVEYRNVSVQLMEARTDNIGSLGGYALLGDGSTSTTFPTFSTPHKASFDGGDYIRESIVLPLSTYSVVMALRLKSSGLALLFDFRNSDASGSGWCYYNAGQLVTEGSAPTVVNGEVTPNFNLNAINTVVVQGMTGNMLSQLTIGSRCNLANFATMDLFAFAIYPGTLSPLQAKYIHNQLMKSLNV